MKSVTQNGRYYAVNAPDAPSGYSQSGYLDVFSFSDGYRKIIYQPVDSINVYVARLFGGTWTDFEMLALNKISSSDINGTISNGTNTITVTKTSFVIFVFRGNTGKFYVGFCSDGYITMPSSLRSDDDVSMSISGATLTITSSYQYDLHYRIIAA